MSSPPLSLSRSGRDASSATVLPSASQSCSDWPKLVYCTMYENGFFSSVTRKYFPSGDGDTSLMNPGWPTRLTVPLFASTSASWPVM